MPENTERTGKTPVRQCHGRKAPAFIDFSSAGGRLRGAEVGLRDAKAASQNFETPLLISLPLRSRTSFPDACEIFHCLFFIVYFLLFIENSYLCAK